MRLGIITREEQYWSLEAFSAAALAALRRRYEVHHLHVEATTTLAALQSLYGKCDVVVNLGSKAIDYDRGCDVPTLFLGHAWMDHGAGIILYLNSKFFRPYDTIAFASSAALHKYRLIYEEGLPAHVLPLCASSGDAGRTQERRAALAGRYSIPPSARIVLYFGRLTWEKNIAGLIEVYRRVMRPGLCLVLAGSWDGPTTYGFPAVSADDHRATIRAAVARLGDVKPLFVGHLRRGDLADLVAAAYVSINMSLCREEDFGISAVESLQSGVPVVCSDWGGLRDIVRHEEVGYRATTWIEAQGAKVDEQEAALYLGRLMEDEELRDRFSASAISLASREFSPDAFADRISPIIDSTLQACSGARTLGRPHIFQPTPWAENAYQKAIANGTVDRIYEDPVLFERLYECYASPRPCAM